MALLQSQAHDVEDQDACHIADLRQNAEFSGKWAKLLPCLLRSCDVAWHAESERMLMPPETCLAMGWPMFDTGGPLMRNPWVVLQQAFVKNAIAGMSSQDLYSCAGNAIHLCSGGAIVM